MADATTPGSEPEASSVPHKVSAERIIASVDFLRLVDDAYLRVDEGDSSPYERRRLWEAVQLLDRALDRFS